MFKTPYKREESPGISDFGPSKVRPEYESQTNINKIMKRFQKTGQLPDLINRNPQYGDFSKAPDYLEAKLTIIRAHEQFEALPADVRKRFSNDPAMFLDFVHDERNVDELVKLGLAKKLESSEVTPVDGVGGVTPEKETR